MTKEIIALPTKAIDLTGQIFGRAIALFPVSGEAGKSITWLCACHCGNTFTRTTTHLNNPRKQSCGCLHHRVSHGLTDSREYRSWLAMLQRCTNPKMQQYSDYGGRGITVCNRWVESFLDFYTDMGERPDGTSLDRIDNDGPYNIGNCRWATQAEQSSNRRTRYKNSKLVVYGGRAMTLTEWGRHLGFSAAALRARLRLGWPLERALQPRVQVQSPP